MKKFYFLIAASLFLSSCSVVKTGTSKTLDIIGPGVIQMPLVADLNVRPTKVSHTKTFKMGASTNADSDVIRELLKRENADVLIEPTFETSSSGGRTSITVYGFPATYVNFRPIQEKDVVLIEVAPKLLQKADKTVSAVSSEL